MKNILIAAVASMTALSFTTPAQAEVTNIADNGFTVRHTAMVDAPPAEVWKSLVAPARWWSSVHSFSGNADNFYLVPQAGGCFCELIRKTSSDNIKSSAGSVEHMRVIFVSNEKAMRLTGALGPLQGEAVNGTMTIELQPEGNQTAVRFTYKIGGYMELPIDKIAPAVDGVIGEQLSRLAALFAPDEKAGGAADTGDKPVLDDDDANGTADANEEIMGQEPESD